MTKTPVAFVPHTQVARPRRGEGVLSGLTFAAKDLFDIRGHAASAGHPAWAASHAAAERDAPLVSALLRAGADLVGVTIMDELAYSLAGRNPHFGTPQNPRAPQRLCGGSSCGSAAAVAACLCDFALGTDTGGSLRVPASFCGLFTMRPSHGRVTNEGVVPLAPSFDTAGFLARDAATFGRVAGLMFGAQGSPVLPRRVLVARDFFARAEPGVRALLENALAQALDRLGLGAERIDVARPGPEALRTAFRRLQGREVWATHGPWVTRVAPDFSPPVRERFAMARALHESGEGQALDEALRAGLRDDLDRLLEPEVVLCLPTVPGIAPRLDDSGPQLEAARAATLELTSLASLTGVPQLVLPAGEHQGAPVGLSFMSACGSDAWLGGLAGSLHDALVPYE
jgi:amidase